MPRVTITLPDKNPQPYRFQLDRRVVTLGRGSNNDIVIDCGSVSVSHAEMLRVEGGYELRDLDSTNGVKLAGERRAVIPLRSGISVKLGDVAFDFQLSDEEREALGREKPEQESPIIRDPAGAPTEPLKAADEEKRRAKLPAQEGAGSSGCGMIVWFLILAAAAFCAGMAVRHQKDTGDSWFETVKSRIQSLPGVSAPADDSGTSEEK